MGTGARVTYAMGPDGAARRTPRAAVVALTGVVVFTIGVGLGWLAADARDDGGSGLPGTPSMVRPGSEPAAFGEAMDRAWRTPDLDADENTIYTAWARGDVLTRVDAGGVRGLDTATGEQLWDAPLPVEGEDLCSAPEPAADATVAVLLYDTEDVGCARLVAVDMTSGEVLWTALAPSPDADDWEDTADILVTGEVVVLSWSSDGEGDSDSAVAHRYALRDGEQLPELTPPAAGACWGERVYRSGVERLLLWSRCDGGEGDDDAMWEVAAYAPGGDPEDEPAWTTRVNTGPWEVYRVLADEPLVLFGDDGVAAYAGGSGSEESKDVEPLWRVREEGDVSWAAISRTTGDRYLMVELSRRDETFLLGYDLGTGERRWDRQVFDQSVVGAEGDHALIVDQPPGERYGPERPELAPPEGQLRVSWVAFDNGDLVTEGTIPEDLGDPELAADDISPVPAWDADRVYVSVSSYTDTSEVARTVAFERNL